MTRYLLMRLAGASVAVALACQSPDAGISDGVAGTPLPQCLRTFVVEAKNGELVESADILWSANDHLDSVLLVFHPTLETDSLWIDAGQREVSYTDSLVDTTLAYSSILRTVMGRLSLDSLGSRRITLSPSQLDSLAGATGDRQVLRVRVEARREMNAQCRTEISILPAI
jgi:hypothetical protein